VASRGHRATRCLETDVGVAPPALASAIEGRGHAAEREFDATIFVIPASCSATGRYELVHADEVPTDAVIVTVRETHGQPMGDVLCSHCPAAEEYAVAGFPRPILIALERAEELRAICKLDRVLIALAPGTRWNPDWGELLGRRRSESSIDAARHGPSRARPGQSKPVAQSAPGALAHRG
jgi:hypothetical protein